MFMINNYWFGYIIINLFGMLLMVVSIVLFN